MRFLLIITIVAISIPLLFLIFKVKAAYRDKEDVSEKTDTESPSAAQTKPSKGDEYKSKDLEKENTVVKYDPTKDKIIKEKEEQRIVGIAEPKGFWSRLIMSQKLESLLMQMQRQDKNSDGFWVNFIRSQQNSKGKNKGKGR